MELKYVKLINGEEFHISESGVTKIWMINNESASVLVHRGDDDVFVIPYHSVLYYK